MKVLRKTSNTRGRGIGLSCPNCDLKCETGREKSKEGGERRLNENGRKNSLSRLRKEKKPQKKL